MEFVKKELSGWGKVERILFPLEIILIIILSIITGDSKIALVSAICGITYTILAGKGKISCYGFGLCGTLCYAYLAFINNFFGNLILYLLYYFPMQIVGIFKWKQHLKKDTREIFKTKLSQKECFLYIIVCLTAAAGLYFILKYFHDRSPAIDAITSILSIAGMIFTVKRCIEQWYIWFIVNGLSTVMWINAYFHGSNCLATVIMWGTYFIMSIYFLYTWKKELNE